MAQLQHDFGKRNRRVSSVARSIRKPQRRSANAISPIAATLTGSNTATALGLTSRGNAPVIDLCCRLSDAGHDPRLRLHAYRAGMLALKVRSIGEGAKLTVRDNSAGKPVLRRWDGAESGAATLPVALSTLANGSMPSRRLLPGGLARQRPEGTALSAPKLGHNGCAMQPAPATADECGGKLARSPARLPTRCRAARAQGG